MRPAADVAPSGAGARAHPVSEARRPIRALHVVTWLNRGGLETWLVQLLQHADRRQLAIDICCKGAHTGEMAAEAAATGAAVFHAPMGRWGPWSRAFRRALGALLRDGSYDVVHSHLGDLSVPVLDVALDAGVSRRVVMYHVVEHRLERRRLLRAPLWLWQRTVRRAIVRKATSVVGCSASVLDAAFPTRRGPGFGILHPSVDVNRFRPDGRARAEVRREIGIPDDVPLVVNVGNLGYAKNQRTVIETARTLRDRGLRAVFLIVGEGPLRTDLAAQIDASGLCDTVRLVGSRQDIPQLLQAADIAVHPSVAEGLPVSVLEYQAAGLPVVGSSIPPVLEATAPPNRRLAAAAEDAAAFADTVSRLVRDAELRQALGEAGRGWVEEHFSTKRSLESLVELYSATGAASRAAGV